MTLLDFIRITRANIILLVVGIIVGGLLGYGATLVQPKTYAATSSGYVTLGKGDDSTNGSAGDILSGDAAAQSKAKAYLPLITSAPVAQKIAGTTKTNLDAASIPGHLSASVEDGSTILRVQATADSPEDAVELANASLKATADTVNDIDGSQSMRVIPLDDAQKPGSPIAPSLKKYVLLGALAGLVVVYIVVFMRRFMDVRVRTTSDLEEATGVGVLGVLPKTNALDQNRFLEDQADHQSEESLRQLRTNLRFVSVDQPPRSIIVTSPNPGEGKSTVTASLAHAFAKAGQPTVLIDADLRRPTIAKIFGIDNGVGLSQILSGQVGIEDAIQRFRESELYVIPAGRIPPNPSELLGSAKMRKLVEELSQEYLVLIDVPPLLPVTDGSLLSTGVDGAILVTKVGATRKDQTEGAMSMINKVKGTVLGTVMNMAPSKGIGSQYYGFGYGGYRSEYKSYYGHSAKEATSVQEKS